MESDSLNGTGKEIQTGGLPMKIETRYLSGRQADTKTTLFGRTMELPVCFYREQEEYCGKGDVQEDKEAEKEKRTTSLTEDIEIIPPYEDVKKIEAVLEKTAEHHALAAGIALDMLFDEKGNYQKDRTGMMGPKTVDDLKYLQKCADKLAIPFLVKGVLSQRDAYQCLKAGVSGIILSRPAWLQEKSITPLEVLPEILKVTAGEMKVLVELEDMGNAFAALVLGADAVCRSPFPEENRQETLLSMQNKLRCLMSVAGCSDLSVRDSTVIWKNQKEDR